MYRNSEGYADPTAGAALSRIMKEFRQEQKRRYADKNRKKVYVASKYAGDADANVAAAIGYCRKVIHDGCMPIASHLLYPQILNDNIPAERELGLLFGLALLHDLSAPYPGYNESNTQKKINHFLERETSRNFR